MCTSFDTMRCTVYKYSELALALVSNAEFAMVKFNLKMMFLDLLYQYKTNAWINRPPIEILMCLCVEITD